jgi:DnaJ-class molecular chaperone
MQDKSTAQSAQSLEEHETRECRSCYGCGSVLDDVFVAYEWTETVQSLCPICHGSGRVSVWLYEHARRS